MIILNYVSEILKLAVHDSELKGSGTDVRCPWGLK
jgi:hypothetical protein